MCPERKNRTTQDLARSRSLARLSGIVLTLPAAMAAGWLLGYLLVDRFLHIYPWGSIVLTLFGAGAGFYEILRILAPGRDHGEPHAK
jgi:F0F1-type ATP synthase assembly protein I